MPRLDADPDALGRTEPNAARRHYRHGTLTGYSLGRRRCDYCRDAYCRYRASRRADGKDDQWGVRMRDTDGHIPAYWFRDTIWNPAVKAAGHMIGLLHPRSRVILRGDQSRTIMSSSPWEQRSNYVFLYSARWI